MNLDEVLPVKKLWGVEKWIVNNDLYCGKYLVILPGYQCSLHYHPIKHETFLVQSGRVELEIGKEILHLWPGDIRSIEPGTPHRFRSEEGACILELSSHHDDLDVVRLEESRKS